MGFPDGLLISRLVWISHSLHSCNVLSHTLAGLSHMLPQNVKTSRLKCSFVPFFLPVYVLLSSFVYFLKIFPFCLHFLAKASLCFYNCNLLLVPLPAILPKISHKCASRASVPRGVNRKSKIHLPQSNLFGSGIMLKYQNILQYSFFFFFCVSSRNKQERSF